MRLAVTRGLVLLFALFLLAPAQLLFAGSTNSDLELEPSGLIFMVLGDRTGSFVIATPDRRQAVSYDLRNAQVSFQILDHLGMETPLFCFDFSESSAAAPPRLKLNVSNSSGHPALDSVGLASSLRYRLASGTVEFVPGSETQCFFIGDSGQQAFGLFGQPPAEVPQPPVPDGDWIFASGFEDAIVPNLQVRFEHLPDSTSAGGSLSYSLVIENVGSDPYTDLAFQEVFPGNSRVFPAALGEGSWTCDGRNCPAPSGTGLIRFTGVELSAEDSIEFQITRPVDGAASGGSSIALFAGAVAGPGNLVDFGADSAVVTVVGAPAALVFTSSTDPVAVGQTKRLTVEVQDASGNRVFDDSRVIRVARVGGSGTGQVTLDEFQSVNAGLAEFDVVGSVAGSITLIAVRESGSSLDSGTTSFSVIAQ